MNGNSELQDRLLAELCRCSSELAAIGERLEAGGRPPDALTDAERKRVEEIGRRTEVIDRQLDESAKEREARTPSGSFVRGLRV